MLVQRPDADAYLMLQDDDALHEREALRDYLVRVHWPGDRPGLVLLYYSGPGTRGAGTAGPTPGTSRGQALLFPPDLARSLLVDPLVMRAVLASSAGHHTPIPDVLNGWVRRHAVDCWYTTPSLAQHVGNVSAIWENAALTGRRRAPWFSGSLEDAFVVEEDLADFPEDAFSCDVPHLDAYRGRVERGRDRMRGSSVVVCGLCRDVRHVLPRLAARVERLGGMFREYRVVLLADDSADGTREFLSDWRTSNPRVEILGDLPGSPRRPPGPRRLPAPGGWPGAETATGTTSSPGYADFDHAIVVDADATGGWSYDGIAHTFGEDDWDFVGSLGLILGPVAETGEAALAHPRPRDLPPCDPTTRRARGRAAESRRSDGAGRILLRRAGRLSDGLPAGRPPTAAATASTRGFTTNSAAPAWAGCS